jgi:hypothetical protein
MSDETEPKRAKGTGVKLAYETLRDEILSLDAAPARCWTKPRWPNALACRARRCARR